MNQSILYRIIAAVLLVLAIVSIYVFKDSLMRTVAILACCLLSVGISSKAGKS